MKSVSPATCTECGQGLGPFDETCPECGELTPLGLQRERDTRREAGLAGYQRLAPRITAIVLLLVLAAALVYFYLYQPMLSALWHDIVSQIPIPARAPTRVP